MMLEISRTNLNKELSEEDAFSLKIMADRYFLKEADKAPQENDAVVVELDVIDEEGTPQVDAEGNKRTIKEVGIVTGHHNSGYEVTLFTGDRGEVVYCNSSGLDVLLETKVEDIKKRVSGALSGGDSQLQKDLEELLMEEIVLGGRILAGAGTDEELTYFNCYVAPLMHDSRGGIAKHREIVMEIMSRGGGVGTNGSTLRPSKTKVHKVRGRSSGAVSWLHDLSNLTHLVEQGGSRRGAQMIALADWHPDIIEFITAKAQKPLKATIRVNGKEKLLKFGKRGNQKLTGANISVLFSDAFMEAYKKDEDWELVFPDVANYSSKQMEIYDKEWHKIGDPWEFQAKTGLPLKTHAVIPARDLVNLISVAMHGSAEPGALFLERANKYSNTWYFNPLICTNPCGEQFLSAWSVCNLGHVNLAKHVRWNPETGSYEVDWDKLAHTVRVLTRALDNVIDATPYYFDVNEDQQKSERRLGLGTMGVDELLKLTGRDYGSADGREMADKVFETITLTAYYESVEMAKEKGSFPEFNAEKFLQSGFMRFIDEVDPYLTWNIAKYGIRNATIITQAPTGTTGTMVQTSTGIEPFYAGEFFRSSRIGFTTQTAPVIKRMEAVGMDTNGLKYAGDYTTEEHLDFQAVAQKWCDSSISKTINAPASSGVDDVAHLLEYAYDNGLKGFTVYVDGSRDEQVLSTKDAILDVEEELKYASYPVKNIYLKGQTELGFAKEDGSLKVVAVYIDELKDITEDILKDAVNHATNTGITAHNSDDCANCGAPLKFEEGCFKCEACGFSKCG